MVTSQAGSAQYPRAHPVREYHWTYLKNCMSASLCTAARAAGELGTDGASGLSTL